MFQPEPLCISKLPAHKNVGLIMMLSFELGHKFEGRSQCSIVPCKKEGMGFVFVALTGGYCVKVHAAGPVSIPTATSRCRQILQLQGHKVLCKGW